MMHSKKLLSLALSLFVAESVVASPCKPPLSATSSIVSTTLPESSTTIISVPSTTNSETATGSSEAETGTATTLASSTITTAVVDTTTAAVQTSTVLIQTSAASSEATTTSSEATITAAEAGTTTATEPFCAQSTVLANATPFSNFNTQVGADDDYDSATLPFPVGIFGSSSSTVYASTNGFLLLDSSSAAYDNGQLPTKNAPPISIMPYWVDLYVPSNAVCGTGFAYEVHETSKGQTFTVEYHLGIYGTSPSSEHFTVSLYKDYPGLVRYVYYQTSGHGDIATVGLQNRELFSQFSYRSLGSIPDQFFIEIDTSSGVARSGRL
ncbi:hypothetical protein KAF25_011106 [Fusarium avenaceum]|uniref:Uncharacterized protein n=1 Tax=Fusarium avenaceum TaxID=40199 RepID=A0A9P7H213_9HYPO|nr:hypothetical protein KAF25_011106 [Fusarium avenaceum]